MWKILVVDSDATLVDMTCDILRSDGHAPTGVTTLSTAYDWAIREKPDLILMDGYMASVDRGLWFPLFGATPETASIPIVLYSTIGADRLPQYLRLGTRGMIQKPFSVDEFLSKIHGTLRPRSAA